MKATTGIAIAGGTVGALLIGRALLQQRAEKKGIDACGALTELLAGAVGAAAIPAGAPPGVADEKARAAEETAKSIAGVACKFVMPWLDQVGDGLRDFFQGERGCLERHAKIVELHGPPLDVVHPVFAAFLERERINGMPAICSKPGVVRYADGYVPFYRGTDDGNRREGVTHPIQPIVLLSKQSRNFQENIATGRPWNPATKTGDPLTRKHLAAMGTFPLARPGSGYVAWWVLGQPLWCPSGATIATDHRGDGTATTPRCWTASSAPPERREEGGTVGDPTPWQGFPWNPPDDDRDHRS